MCRFCESSGCCPGYVLCIVHTAVGVVPRPRASFFLFLASLAVFRVSAACTQHRDLLNGSHGRLRTPPSKHGRPNKFGNLKKDAPRGIAVVLAHNIKYITRPLPAPPVWVGSEGSLCVAIAYWYIQGLCFSQNRTKRRFTAEFPGDESGTLKARMMGSGLVFRHHSHSKKPGFQTNKVVVTVNIYRWCWLTFRFKYKCNRSRFWTSPRYFIKQSNPPTNSTTRENSNRFSSCPAAFNQYIMQTRRAKILTDISAKISPYL